MNIEDIPAVNRILNKVYKSRQAPIVDFIAVQTKDPFKVLVSTILSARTKDETTTEVCKKLFRVIHKPEDLKKIPLKELEKLVFPAGFFRTKAKHLKLLPDVLEKEFQGRIPDEIDDLCRLPGVGRKTANLVRSVAFNKPAICVDVHVHRISNRTGLIKTKTPFETEMRLREILPQRYWITWNSRLVSFGQSICRPINPICSVCPIKHYCKRIGVATKHESEPPKKKKRR